MSDLGDLLELMFAAHLRFASVQASLHEWSDGNLWREAARRWAEMQPQAARRVVLAGQPAADGTSERAYRVWHEPRHRRWRVESERRGYKAVTVIDGERWWGSNPDGGFMTNVRPDGIAAGNLGGQVESRFIELLFDPASLLASTNIEPVGDAQIAGRRTLTAVAHWRPGISLVDIDWPYGDELHLGIDDEYGVLLRLEVVLDEKVFLRWEVEDISFDVDLPASLFAGPADAKFPFGPDFHRPTGRGRSCAT